MEVHNVVSQKTKATTTQAQRDLAAIKSAVAEALINKRENYSMSQKDYSRLYGIDIEKIKAVENMSYDFSLEELLSFLEFLNINVHVSFNDSPVI